MNLIVAADRNWGIGKDNRLLASLPSDMKYFREHTLGKAVVMGRKTLESMPGGKPLPGRTNYVLTANPDYQVDGCIMVHGEYELFDAISHHNPDDVLLIGGGSLYKRFYKYCDKLYVTKIDAEFDADTFIPDFDLDDDYQVISESEPVTENGLTYRFVVYKKKKEGIDRSITLRF